VYANLAIAYGDSMTKSERTRLARRVFSNCGESAVEVMYVTAGRGEDILKNARIEGLDQMRSLIAQGRGVLAVSAHMGNWELIPLLVGRKLPCRVAAVARELSNPGLEELIVEHRQRDGLRVFTRGEQTARTYVRFLRKGNALGVLGDLDTSKGGDGLFVDFFGRSAWTQRGIAWLARLSGAAIVPAFMHRDPTDPRVNVLEILPPLPEIETDDTEVWTREMTQAYTRTIETMVRRYPDEWMWMHRRWYHQPDGPLPRIMRRRAERSEETAGA
jgi:KDO2-lipid IV(A) lauroyltransferase